MIGGVLGFTLFAQIARADFRNRINMYLIRVIVPWCSPDPACTDSVGGYQHHILSPVRVCGKYGRRKLKTQNTWFSIPAVTKHSEYKIGI